MKKIVLASFVATFLAGVAVLWAQEASQKEHQWLQQFVGEWELESEAIVEPGQPPIKGKGTETIRAIGEFWVVFELKATVADMPITAIQTLGYDPQKKKYVGTWIDSLTSYLWKYEGTVDAAGKVLTFEAEGPNPSAAGKLCKFKDVHEFKTKDHRVNTSAMQDEAGNWVTFMTGNARRTK